MCTAPGVEELPHSVYSRLPGHPCLQLSAAAAQAIVAVLACAHLLAWLVAPTCLTVLKHTLVLFATLLPHALPFIMNLLCTRICLSCDTPALTPHGGGGSTVSRCGQHLGFFMAFC